jgi:hypothetical protein
MATPVANNSALLQWYEFTVDVGSARAGVQCAP